MARFSLECGTCHRFVIAIRNHLHPVFLSNLTTIPGLRERRRRMSEVIRVAFRQLGGGCAPFYLAQLPPLLFGQDVWQDAKPHFGLAQDAKQILQTAIAQIAPVRNEIAHVREVDPNRLLRANLARTDVLAMLGRD